MKRRYLKFQFLSDEIREIFCAAKFYSILEVLIQMVFLAGPDLKGDLGEEEFVFLEENRASKAPMKQSLREKVRQLELNNETLETALREKNDVLIMVEAEHARELRDKESETRKIVGGLQEQLAEARGQLYGGQPQSFSGIPEAQSPEPQNPDESEYHQLANYITEQAYFKPYFQEVLFEAAAMVCVKNYQGALIHLDRNISATDSTIVHANATLLKSSILRIAGDPKRGLELAEHVVYIANVNNLTELLGKAQLYRGLCLYELGLYADALRCYVRAASIRWFAIQVTILTTIAKKKRDALPNGSKGRRLSPDFQEIPSSTSAKGFGSFSEEI